MKCLIDARFTWYTGRPVKRNRVLLRANPDTSSLFRPIANRSLELKNRIVMAPMTHLFLPGSASADYYRRRAEGRAGMIRSEGAVILQRQSPLTSSPPLWLGKGLLWTTPGPEKPPLLQTYSAPSGPKAIPLGPPLVTASTSCFPPFADSVRLGAQGVG
ncbi:oxidoreductase [Rhizobium leguminosarum]|uniref:oxidoreductase n=1 Tax=Rhizobium leguminosarum TaxID=384 RepID=UPI003CFC245A